MKLLFVNSSLSSGGSERVMTILANELARKNEVDMLVLERAEKETYTVNEKVRIIRPVNQSKGFINKFKKIAELRSIIKKGKYDSVISFIQEINNKVIISSIGLRVSLIVSERCNPKMDRKKIHNIISSIFYPKVKFVVLQTDDVKKMYSKRMQKNMVVIPNPVDSNIPEPFKGKRDNRIVGVGRLTGQKNFSLLIKAYAKIINKFPDYILEIYGEGPMLKELTDLAKELKIGDKIFFKGYVPDVDELIRNASLYISTSDYEGISNSMIEALAMGIPTICTDCPVGGAKMMINNNENGILISVGDQEALEEAIVKVLSNKTFSHKISKNSIKIKEKYSINNIIKKWEGLININNE